MKNQEMEELLAKAVQGDLSPEESESLMEACREDAELGRRLVRLMQVERLAGLALDEDGEVFAREFRYRLEADGDDEFSVEVGSRLKRRKVVKMVSGWMAAAALVMVSLFFLMKGDEEMVVEFVRVEASELSNDLSGLEVGERVTFEEGLVELRFLTGVRVVIEAPADFEVTGENRGFLHRGKLVAEVDDETAHGFIIDGPSGRLVDLGTKFAVSVDQGGEMEVHVIEGEVDATATGGKTSRLVKDQAMRLAGGEASAMEVDVGKFVTRMPDYQNQPPRYVRWGFDERTDGVVPNTGSGLAEEKAEGRLKSFSGKGKGPGRVEGRFGKGLSFDGEDGFFESDFRGVAGSQPRTVTFWVKTPKDFNRLQGYGVINWGKIRPSGGTAWQVSVNGTDRHGPLGRLRIGTHYGQVIGTTDLRDGEWHHCAVVMYGDEEGQPNTATHILLYVDGKLEPAARKSVRVVDTVTSSEGEVKAHGIWMGRNLTFAQEGVPSAASNGRFFRGEIDEMVICDMAMNQTQIVRLMETNEMPD